MKLKKINAVLGLGSIAALMAHVLYNVYCYMVMYYNQVLKIVFTAPVVIFICLHAITGMSVLFLHTDGVRADLYPELNKATVYQRISAALIFPLLLIHMNTHHILKATSAPKNAGFFIVIIIEILFFSVAMTHVATSFSRALVTLGRLESIDAKKKLDKAVYIIMGILFAISVIVIVRGQLILFS